MTDTSPPDDLAVRAYRPDDAAATLEIFIRAILQGAASAYSLDQRQAWLGEAPRAPQWNHDRMNTRTFVAERGGVVVGFADVNTDGYVDRLFVHPAATRQGVGGALLRQVHRVAESEGLSRLTTHASEVARPVFEKAGFSVVHAESVSRGAVHLSRYFMERTLPDARS